MSARMKLEGNILVTGATSGLGLEISKLLIERGCTVFGTGRKQPVINGNEDKYKFVPCDFGDLEQTARTISELCSEHKFDFVINNAGVLSPPLPNITTSGFGYSFQVNFIAHLIINEIIIQKCAKEQLPHFVAITSPVWKRGSTDRAIACLREGSVAAYKPFYAYSDSKLLLLLLFSDYSGRFGKTGSVFTAFNPGVFSSGIYRMQHWWFRYLYRIAAPFMTPPVKVARDFIAGMEEIGSENGFIFDRKGRKTAMPQTSKELRKLNSDLFNNINFTSLL